MIQRKDGSSALLTVPFQLHLCILKRCEKNMKAKVPDQNLPFSKFRYVKMTCALEKNQSVGSTQLIHGLVGTSHCVLSKIYTQVSQFNENSFKLSVYGQSHPQIPKYHCGNVIPHSRLMCPYLRCAPKPRAASTFPFCLITTDPINTFLIDLAHQSSFP